MAKQRRTAVLWPWHDCRSPGKHETGDVLLVGAAKGETRALLTVATAKVGKRDLPQLATAEHSKNGGSQAAAFACTPCADVCVGREGYRCA
eukprot:365485-Chlamydomonas_euryale.AAC.4